MRRFVVGVLVGATLMFSAQAFGAGNMLGKKVQGEISVLLEGSRLDTAIIVDGKSYAPVRSISEAAGLEVSVENKEIRLSQPRSEETVSSTEATTTESNPEIAEIDNKIIQAKSNIETIKNQALEIYLQSLRDPKRAEELKPRYDDLLEQGKIAEAALVELEMKKAELLAQ